jgi:hypothetical protein
MLYKKKQLDELYFMKHIHDSDGNNYEYENNIVKRSISSYMFNNDNMNHFLLLIQPSLSLLFDNMNIIKNFKNYLVDKYEYRQMG